MKDERKVPKGRLGRMARLAAMGAKAGVGRVMGKESATAALDTAQILGTLRGLAAKAGQMAAYVDGMVPDEHKDAYESGMKSLLAATPRSSSADIRKSVEAELKAPIDSLFAEWNDEPIASASIGQVHKARLPDGLEVAVKVQHPGIADAVESDLNNLGVLEGALGLTSAKKFDPKRLFEEVRARFREELDYDLEAKRQTHFRDFHAGDPTIRIPQVISSHSAKGVLTTEFVKGVGFEEACQRPEDARRAYCETLWRFVYRGNLVGGMFNADPHPGNYLFGEDGIITFLDFGCVQTLEPERQRLATNLHIAAIQGDDDAFKAAVVKLMDTRGGTHEERVLRQLKDIYRPLSESPFRITRTYSGSLLKQMREMNKDSRNTKGERYAALPPGILFMNRLQFGFYSVLARLNAEVDYAQVERGFLPQLS